MLHQIGVGALGPVFRTYEPERDRLVAVKVFRLDITPEQAQTLADELSRAAEAGGAGTADTSAGGALAPPGGGNGGEVQVRALIYSSCRRE